MYYEERINHSYAYSVWRAQIHASSLIRNEQANIRWGFVFKQYENNSIQALMIGPSAHFYQLADEQASYDCWGVELHESVVCSHLAKSLFGHDNKEILLSDNYMRIGDKDYDIPLYENLVAFIDQLVSDGILSLDDVIRSDKYHTKRTRQRLVKKTTGLTSTQIKHISMSEQAISLLDRGMPITNVVNELGFTDQSHLAKIIKRTTSKTPGYFRKKR